MNISDKRRTAVISADAHGSIKEALGRLFRIIELPRDPLLPAPVSSHPDMIIRPIGKKLIVPAEYYEANRSVIDSVAHAGCLQIAVSASSRGNKYPLDVGMNAAVFGRYLICREGSVCREIADAAGEEGLITLAVRQGYAGCSTLVCGEAAVTTDPGISSALEKAGMKCLYINNEGIRLRGYDSGFIGGASGYDGRTVYLTGSVDSMKDGVKLKDFLKNEKIAIIELTDMQVTDIGGIMFF